MGLAAWLERLRWPLSLAVLAAGGIAGVALLWPEPAPPLVISPPPPSVHEIRVYVSGAVVNPGVYAVGDDARVEDALLAAGGPTTEADLDRLNLSIRVRDEMHVQVPYKQVNLSPSSIATPAVNLNSASAAELEALPGIGPVTAQRIIDQRLRNGPFRQPEDLLAARLVSASTFEKIKGRITAP